MFVALLGEVLPQAIATISSMGTTYWVGPKSRLMPNDHTPTYLAWSRVSGNDAVERGILVMQMRATVHPSLTPKEILCVRQPISSILRNSSTMLCELLPPGGNVDTSVLILWR